MKTILITGAAGGIDSCLVEEYISRGYRVFGADLVNNEKMDALQRKAPDSFDFLKADDASHLISDHSNQTIWCRQNTSVFSRRKPCLP